MLISIGIPVRHEGKNIPQLIHRLENTISSISDTDLNFEIIVNNNCSDDNSLDLLLQWAAANSKVRIYDLDYSLSFQQSIQDLMTKAKGDCFILLQSDLQDPPEVISDFISQWKSGSRIVLAKAISRKEWFLDRWIRSFFYQLLTFAADGTFIRGFQDFYLIDKPAYHYLRKLPSEGLFLRGHITSKFPNFSVIEYSRNARSEGNSNFNFALKYQLALDGLLLFGTRFIRIISVSSFIAFILSVFSIITVVVLNLLGYRAPIAGWASIVVALLSIISLLGMATGIILEYQIRIYRVLVLTKGEVRQ